jgi:capsular polysaccharide biosynthesis protein
VRGALSVLPYAAVAMGVHGANLANIAFCYPPTTVIEITLHEPEVGKAK